MNYLFSTTRLGFRKWSNNDLTDLAKLCADPEVMRYFPSTLNKSEAQNFIDRLIDHHEKNGHTYYLVELLSTQEFIGFIGLAYQEYESYFTPCVDIGWRLKKEAWGNGYATEGAEACLKHAFQNLKIEEIYSTTTHNNQPSEKVMQKIGMKKMDNFVHPKIASDHPLQPMVVYKITSSEWRQA